MTITTALQLSTHFEARRGGPFARARSAWRAAGGALVGDVLAKARAVDIDPERVHGFQKLAGAATALGEVSHCQPREGRPVGRISRS